MLSAAICEPRGLKRATPSPRPPRPAPDGRGPRLKRTQAAGYLLPQGGEGLGFYIPPSPPRRVGNVARSNEAADEESDRPGLIENVITRPLFNTTSSFLRSPLGPSQKCNIIVTPNEPVSPKITSDHQASRTDSPNETLTLESEG